MDNGAYSSGFEPRYLHADAAAVPRSEGLHRFVSCPDVVGDAAAALAQWPFWSREMIRGSRIRSRSGSPRWDARLRSPVERDRAVFVGGYMPWKFAVH